MVKRGMVENFKARMYGAAFGIVATVNEASDSRLNHRAGTHRARLDRDVKSGAIQAIISEAFGRRPQGDDLCMRAWVASGNRAVSRPRQEAIPQHDDASDGHLAFFRRSSRFSERQLHVCEVIHRKLTKSLGSGNSREKIFDHSDVLETIAVAGVFFVHANHTPPRRFA